MRSALIVHSKHTKDYARLVAKKYRDVKFLKVKGQPGKEILKIKSDRDIVIGVGGGSVIDTAKIISRHKRCIAVPTTASGACVTAYATIWGNQKLSIVTKKPILQRKYSFPIKLSYRVYQSTTFDALSHAIESLWSKNANNKSKSYAKKAISILKKFLFKKIKDTERLVTAGNLAGQAIAIAKTNVVHATSYPITLEYGIDHGAACGILLPYFVEYMDFKALPGLFSFSSTKELVVLLKRLFVPLKIKNFDVRLIAKKAMRYDKINYGPKRINKKALEKILEKVLVDKKVRVSS